MRTCAWVSAGRCGRAGTGGGKGARPSQRSRGAREVAWRAQSRAPFPPPLRPDPPLLCAGRRRFRVTRLPRYLVLAARRFLRNQFFVEKNPTIINFPVKNLDLGAVIPVPKGAIVRGGGERA